MTKRNHEIRDPIHGLIPVSDLELKVIDTSVFQRLRNINQLAMAYLGFPGAHHTRFEHCIGVMHIASKICEHLNNCCDDVNLNSEDVDLIRLAGLLHDVGHGPFSHISEDLLQENYNGESDKNEIHEEISRRIITENDELLRVLGEKKAKEISKLLDTNQEIWDFRHEIVSGSIDADKMDYLLRDSYYSGVKYGIFDLDRLINVMIVASEENIKRLAIKYEGLETAEQYVLAKYFISCQVYGHRIRRITDLMIVESIKEEIKNNNHELKNLYIYKNSSDYIKNYLKYNDNSIVSLLTKGTNNNLFNKLVNRKLLKELLFFKLDIKSDNTDRLDKIRKGKTNDLCRQIAKEFNLDDKYIYIRLHSIKCPSPYRAESFFDEESICIKTKSTNSTLFRESTLITDITEEAERNKISVYGIYNDTLPEMKYEKNKEEIEKKVKDYLEVSNGG